METVLVVDKNRAYAHTVVKWLKKNDINACYVLSMDTAKSFLCRNEVSMVFSNSKLGKNWGIQLLEWMKVKGYYIPFFIMTDHTDIQEIVDAIKKGAENYFQKPIQTEKVLSIVKDILESKKRSDEIKHEFYMGQSPLFLKLQYHIRLVAPVDMTVLIRGASGTGKEWVASHIHTLSGRADAPFVAVDCGTLPKELAASELFGYVKGAFTGAIEDKVGMFARASHGTLFLDEIGNLNMNVQMLLLRALQEKHYRPIGSREEIKADIRLIAATNEDLEKAIIEGKFREDLFHRLNEFPIQVPLLAECLDDIVPLAEFMLDIANQELDKNVKGFDLETQKKFKAYSWPGNIRELRTIVKRAVLLAKDDWITAEDVGLLSNERLKEYTLKNERTERNNIVKALEATNNNRTATAKLLGISRSTLYLKLKKYRLM
ncbi:sigma-54-dependent transcriptional regulator [Bacteroides fragilis]|jgi:putative regulatory protein|uniref:sigma-54-dependent transcriptional regulator n=1 Tax=Bacteroides fragilis TaxID=817 RepID=UPI0004462F6F|nr:sigma-54 dependent transcriptional regulator [Bacteroides fragilis]EXZ03817.1 AAA domain family protein [Bacteroides fragilis str. DS-208]MCE8973898.1 sigma-54 dependent transcriptional regulator [Bacteroides fragilis]